MPQMMPMYWLMMTLLTMTLLMIITSFIYFLTIYSSLTYPRHYFLTTHNWIWKW